MSVNLNTTITKRALLIGIKYISIPNISLHGCINDVVNMRNMLIDAYDYDPSAITILRDDIADLTKLPTCDNIIQQLFAIVGQSPNLDEIWIHYSGHGSQINHVDPNKTTDGKMDEVIVPMDYSSKGVITDFQLLDIIKRIHPRCRAILLFDSCHSGTICDLPYNFQYSPATYPQYSRTIIEGDQLQNSNIFVMSGCKDSQTSADSYSTLLQEPVGAFSSAVMDCLRASHHNISIMQLYQNVCANLIAEGFQQTPQLSSSSSNPTYIFTKPVITVDGKSSMEESVEASTPIITKSVLQNTMRMIMKF